MLLTLIALLSTTAMAGDVAFTHQGRLLDAAGGPINGERSVTVELYDADSGGTAAWSDTFDAVPFVDGFFAVTLSGPGTRTIDLDQVTADGDPLWLAIDVQGGAPLARQPMNMVPRAAWAERAGGIALIDTTESGTDCNTLGGIAYDTTSGEVLVCNGTEWAALAAQPQVGVALNGTSRTWADGSLAVSCNAYRNPTNGQEFVGENAVTGRYTIAPQGSAFDVYCDMDTGGGGWTLVLRASNNDSAIDFGPARSGWSATSHRTLDDLSLTNVNGSNDYVSLAYGQVLGNDVMFRHQLGDQYQYSAYSTSGDLTNRSLRSILVQSDVVGGRVCFNNVTFPPGNTIPSATINDLVLAGNESGDNEPAKIALRNGCAGDSQLVQMGYTRSGHGTFEVWSQDNGITWPGFASAFVFVR